MCFGGGNSGQQIAESEAKRRSLIEEGLGKVEGAFSGFTPEFYGAQQAKVLASSLPQLGQQYRQTSRQLGFNLAGQGLLHSSAARNLGSSLQLQLAQSQRDVGNQAIQSVQGLQQQVGGEKSRIIGQLEASADPTAAATQALSSASQFQYPSLAQPIGQLFQNWANVNLAHQYSNLGRTSAFTGTPNFNFGITPNPIPQSYLKRSINAGV